MGLKQKQKVLSNTGILLLFLKNRALLSGTQGGGEITQLFSKFTSSSKFVGTCMALVIYVSILILSQFLEVRKTELTK